MEWMGESTGTPGGQKEPDAAKAKGKKRAETGEETRTQEEKESKAQEKGFI